MSLQPFDGNFRVVIISDREKGKLVSAVVTISPRLHESNDRQHPQEFFPLCFVPQQGRTLTPVNLLTRSGGFGHGGTEGGFAADTGYGIIGSGAAWIREEKRVEGRG